MSFLFLSPSTQDSGLSFSGHTDCYWMNRLADDMAPDVISSGINVARNSPDCSVATAIRQVNLGIHDFYLALRVGTAPETAGKRRGVTVQYCQDDTDSMKMAEILIDNLRTCYPLPKQVLAVPCSKLDSELHLTAAPACLAELGYVDNPDDAAWLTGDISSIAQSLALSATEYFGLPFLPASSTYPAVADTASALLGGPGPGFRVIGKVAAGGLLTVYNEYNGWYVVSSHGLMGYTEMQAVTLL